jgi:Zn-dependent protease with chaperone function
MLVAGPHLRRATWVLRCPNLGIGMWQAVCLSAVIVPVLVGLTLLVPATALVTDIADWVHASEQGIRDAYGFRGDSLKPAIGLALIIVIMLWSSTWFAYELIRLRRDRKRIRTSLALISTAHLELGIRVLPSAALAAFALPGRSPQVVVTSGALQVLTPPELAGVLAHERAHLNSRHHLAIAMSQSLKRAFKGVALFSVAADETRQLVELAADDAAAQRVNRLNVASAIVRLASMRSPATTLPMADSCRAHATVARVNRLLTPMAPLQRGWKGTVLIAGLSLVAIPVAVAVAPTAFAALEHAGAFPIRR